MKSLTFARIPWVWGFVGATCIWVLLFVVTGRGVGETLSLALSLAPYLVLVSIGQMLVITVGPGNIDVAVAPVIALAGFVSLMVMSSTSSVPLGLGAGIGVGIVVAIGSVIGILWLEVPPIVATLAAGLIASSFTLMLNQNFTASPNTGLQSFLNLRPAGVSLFAAIVAAVTALVVLVIRASVFGRRLLAVGQNWRAAERVGISVPVVTATAYLASGGLCGLAGSLLASYIAPSPSIGQPYLLNSIAVVIIGGTLLTGGRPMALGVWGGALFLILLEGLLNSFQLSYANQNIIEGVLLMFILSLAAGTAPSAARRTRPPQPPPKTPTSSSNHDTGGN